VAEKDDLNMGVVTIDSTGATSGFDIRQSIGDNLLHLLNLATDSRVLIFGAELKGWEELFRFGGFQASFDDKSPRRECGLVLYHSDCANSQKEFAGHLKQLRGMLAPQASLLVFAENFYSLSNLKRLRRGKIREILNKVRSGYNGFCRALEFAGFSSRQEFLPMPKVANPEELVAVGSHLLELPHCSHPLLRLALRSGRLQPVADGYVFLCAPKRIEEGALLRTVAKLVSRGGLDSGLSLERVDLRQRGAMILFVTEQSTVRRLIVRVVSDPRTCGIVRRNQDLLQTLRKIPALPDAVRQVLPAPQAEGEYGSSVIFIESMLSGILAWKANHGCLRNTIYRESLEFLLQMNRATRTRVQLEERELDRLFAEDLLRLKACPGVDPGLQELAQKIVFQIRRLLYRREVFLVRSHGDYGYGNILVDPRTASLTGVIDWDTGRSLELAGVDLLNLLIQKARIEKKEGLFLAFATVVHAVIGRGGLDEDGHYRGEFGIKGDLVQVCLGVALLRYMSRAAQYPEVFAVEQGDYKRALDFFRVDRGENLLHSAGFECNDVY
jgi:hypothetical protein